MIKLRSSIVPYSGLFPLIQCGGNPCKLKHAEQLIGAVLQYLVVFSGAVAVLVVFWSAYQFITAAGDPAKAEGARKTLWSGLIGLIIVVAAYAFIRVFANTIFGGTVQIPQGITPQ